MWKKRHVRVNRKYEEISDIKHSSTKFNIYDDVFPYIVRGENKVLIAQEIKWAASY